MGGYKEALERCLSLHGTCERYSTTAKRRNGKRLNHLTSVTERYLKEEHGHVSRAWMVSRSSTERTVTVPFVHRVRFSSAMPYRRTETINSKRMSRRLKNPHPPSIVSKRARIAIVIDDKDRSLFPWARQGHAYTSARVLISR